MELDEYEYGQRVEVYDIDGWYPGTVRQAYRSREVCRVDIDDFAGLCRVKDAESIRPLGTTSP